MKPDHDLLELRGVVPPMITPFGEDDSVDVNLLAAEATFLLQTGVNGLVVGGSTGEGAGLSPEELFTAVAVVVQRCAGAVPVLAGVIADTAEEAIRLGVAARRAGARGLQVPPPHFHVTCAPKVLARYYRAITDRTGLPLIIYNVMPWAQVATESLDRITRENPMILGVKQSGGNIGALTSLLACTRGKIRIYSAIDDLVFPSLMLGADGTISGISSVFPRETIEMWCCARSGDTARGLELHNALLPVWRSIDGPQFPSNVKYAMALLGRPTGKPRGPFTWPCAPAAERIRTELLRAGLLRAAGRPEVPQVGVEPQTCV